MRTKVLLILALLAIVGTPDSLAQSAGAFSRIGFGARGIALGNALVADGFDDGSPYYNPALAPLATSQSFEASAALLSFDRELQFLQFSTPLQPSAGIALGLIHGGVSDIDGRDNSGYHTGTYSTDEFALFLAFGTHITQRVTVGMGLQLFRADMHERLEPVHSIGIDAGVTYLATDQLRLAIALDDLLARYSWDTSPLYGAGGTTNTDRFPMRLRLGAAYVLQGGRAQVLAEYESGFAMVEHRSSEIRIIGDRPTEVLVTDESLRHASRLRLGGEYRLADAFTVRAGVDRIGSSALEGITPSGGFMVEQPAGPLRLRGEYAFLLEPYGTGAMHLVTLRVFL